MRREVHYMQAGFLRANGAHKDSIGNDGGRAARINQLWARMRNGSAVDATGRGWCEVLTRRFTFRGAGIPQMFLAKPHVVKRQKGSDIYLSSLMLD